MTFYFETVLFCATSPLLNWIENQEWSKIKEAREHATLPKFFLETFLRENLLSTKSFGILFENIVKINFAHFSTKSKFRLRSCLKHSYLKQHCNIAMVVQCSFANTIEFNVTKLQVVLSLFFMRKRVVDWPGRFYQS